MSDFKTLCIELLKEWDNAPTPSDIIDTDVFGVIRKIRTALETEETMTDNHPITPPPELVDQWVALLETRSDAEVFAGAAQWGADQELEACLQWFSAFYCMETWMQKDLEKFREARRPKPPSKKQRGLTALEATNLREDDPLLYQEILNAIEGLPDD